MLETEVQDNDVSIFITILGHFCDTQYDMNRALALLTNCQQILGVSFKRLKKTDIL